MAVTYQRLRLAAWSRPWRWPHIRRVSRFAGTGPQRGLVVYWLRTRWEWWWEVR